MATSISPEDLVARYDGFLLDAYGVLVTADGAVAGAAEFLDRLRASAKPFVIVTNDASRSAERSAEGYRRRGIHVDAGQIVTSGELLSTARLRAQRCLVLGTADAQQYAVDAGAQLVEIGEPAEVVVIADEIGYEFLPAIDATLSMIVRRVRAGHQVRIVVPNPDMVYPKGDGGYGLASGAIAAMLTAGLERLLGVATPAIEALGKPQRPIFDRGLALLGTDRDRTVMVGDQIQTDVCGALNAGIDAALVLTGVATPSAYGVQPTWILEGFAQP